MPFRFGGDAVHVYLTINTWIGCVINSKKMFAAPYRESWLFMNGAFPRIKKVWACVYHCSVCYGVGDMCFSRRKV